MSAAELARRLKVPTSRKFCTGSAPLPATRPYAWVTSSARARSFGWTRRSFIICGSPGRRWGKSIKVLPTLKERERVHA